MAKRQLTSLAVAAGLLLLSAGGWFYFSHKPQEAHAQTQAQRAVDALALRVLSANIRFALGKDGANNWPSRQEMLVKTLRRHDPDILGVQEAMPAQSAYLLREMPGYSFLPAPKESDNLFSSLASTVASANLTALFYRADRFDLLATESGLLRPEGLQRNPTENAYYTLAVLRDKLGKFPDLVVINTHLRHEEKNAEESAKRIHEVAGNQLKQYPKARVLVMGDMNHDRESAVYKDLLGAADAATRLTDPFDYTKRGPKENWGTWHNFTGKADRAWPVDLILISPDLTATPTAILRDRDETTGRYPSDHFFVTITLKAK